MGTVARHAAFVELVPVFRCADRVGVPGWCVVLHPLREHHDGQAVSVRWEVSSRHPGAVATLGEVWQYRKLLGFIGDRALRKMYRRTVLGWLWLFINPLFPIAMRALIFGGLLGVGSN